MEGGTDNANIDDAFLHQIMDISAISVSYTHLPAWLEADMENLKGVVKELPTRDEIDVPVNEVLIVELYSK